ncbi:MAG: hypothetical protein FWC40_06585 [Proteobacteria bacterium]|nr:hypothetical protein [Pseudomonadota bacterium]
MSGHPLERRAEALSEALRIRGKALGKSWRVQARALLSETFAAMHSAKTDEMLCAQLEQQLDQQIEAARLKSPEENPDNDLTVAQPQDELPQAMTSQTDEGSPDLPEIESPQATISQTNDSFTSPSDLPARMGYFDLVRIRIRCFFRLRACIEPLRIGGISDFAERYTDSVQRRIDRFIAVLSKNDAITSGDATVKPGYQEELIQNMPERGLVLHPKKKKRS